MRRQNAQKKFVKVVEGTKGAENATESWQYWIRKRGGGWVGGGGGAKQSKYYING